jgi:hypothetical protein
LQLDLNYAFWSSLLLFSIVYSCVLLYNGCVVKVNAENGEGKKWDRTLTE